MNYHRLELLADYLEEGALRYEFDMSVWRCATAACAVGHAADIPELKRAGLFMTSIGAGAMLPAYSTEDDVLGGWAAVRACFGLEDRQATCLFSCYSYQSGVTAAEVAERIRQVIADDKEQVR